MGSAQGLLVATGIIAVGDVWQDNKTWLNPASSGAFEVAMDELNAAAHRP
jgi:hypothetical protein